MNPVKRKIRDLVSLDDSVYLQAMKEGKIEPNFYCSLEYFQKAHCHEVIENGLVTVMDRSNCPLLPSINLIDRKTHPYLLADGIWADLVGFRPFLTTIQMDKTFLDYNYIYDPQNFQEMRGSQWATFRKNSRKFPNRYGNEKLRWTKNISFNNKLESFGLDVIKDFRDNQIHDAGVMLSCLFKGKNRWFLIDIKTNNILAVNIWDDNHLYVNYRFALCMDIPFLSEYIRLSFYRQMVKEKPGKLVNDGGVLDRPTLKAFKDKLNPVKVNKVYSWQ